MNRVEVVSSLSDSTVEVVSSCSTNLMSAVCIIAFNALKKKSTQDYTYSFYLLILIHIIATLYFASFKAQWLSQKEEDAHKKKKRAGSRLPRPRMNKDKPAIKEWKQQYPFLLPTPGTTASMLVSDI